MIKGLKNIGLTAIFTIFSTPAFGINETPEACAMAIQGLSERFDSKQAKAELVRETREDLMYRTTFRDHSYEIQITNPGLFGGLIINGQFIVNTELVLAELTLNNEEAEQLRRIYKRVSQKPLTYSQILALKIATFHYFPNQSFQNPGDQIKSQLVDKLSKRISVESFLRYFDINPRVITYLRRFNQTTAP